MVRLDESIGSNALFLPLQALHEAHKLLTLLDSQHCDDASVPRAYYDAFQIAAAQSDIARATIFADRAASARTILEGSDSPTTQKMKSLARDPSQHAAYGFSNNWKTKANAVPKELEAGEFEDWLWRKESARPRKQQSSTGSLHISKYATLRCPTTFPVFNQLPGDDDIDLKYFKSNDGFSYNPRRHWCFLAEIVDVEWVMRLSLFVKDKVGKTVRLAFYTEDRGHEVNPILLQKGFTVVVLYAEQHGFLDMSEGIRHENPYAINIFPVSLDRMLGLSDKVQRYAPEAKNERACAGCDRTGGSLLACAKCGLFRYCNKSCQRAGWNEKGHKSDCKLLKDLDLKRMFLVDWEHFSDWHRFPLEQPKRGK